jgi:negative regulator of flagellin synthesis FlgM
MAVSNINGLNGAPLRSGGGKTSGARAAQKPASGEAAASSSPVAADSLKGSERLRALEASVAKTPEVNVERVNALKQAIADGSYQVNTAKLADKLVEMESSFRR